MRATIAHQLRSVFVHRLPTAALIAVVLVCGAAVARPLRGLAQPDPGDKGKADDAVRRAILSGSPPPMNILRIRQRLTAELKGTLTPHIVVNGGHDNPARGDATSGVKFMVFESYEGPPSVAQGDLFMGYFLGPRSDRTLEVSPGFVELIAWDRTKRAFNFWELDNGGWHYRGDSNDILADVARVNTGANPPVFAAAPKLRCSGCHTLGTPIMKELEAPHNDWWTTARKLNLGPFSLSSGTSALDPAHVAGSVFRDAADASSLSKQVKATIDRLVSARSEAVPSGLTLKHQLRSLVTTMEMNLVSDGAPLDDTARTTIEIPQDFFVDARLVGDRRPITVNKALYRQALAKVGSRFAAGETPGLVDSHHAFVVPARSHVDNRIIDALIMTGMLDDELIADVLALDFSTPVFSTVRASVFTFLPNQAKDAADLRSQLIVALKSGGQQTPVARELLTSLTDPGQTAAAHQRAARAYRDACSQAAGELDAVVDWLTIASQRRIEVTRAAAETAQHPRGQITEPGFRIVFPTDQLKPRPGALRLSPSTCRAVKSP